MMENMEYLSPETETSTAILEVEESGEYSFIPWVSVWQGETLLARFNQHKLDQIYY
jgi:hypothetical protein